MVAQGALGLEVLLAGSGAPATTKPGRLGLPGLGAQGSDPLKLGGDQGELLLALVAVAFGLGGVVAEHEPAGRVALAEADLLDPQVVADLLVAALPGQHLGDVGGAVAQPLPGDPVPARAGQVGQVVVAGEAAVHHGDDPAQPPAAQVILDLLEDGHVVGVARPAPHPDRDPLAGDRQPDHHLRQVAAMVLGVPIDPERARAALLGVAFEERGGGVEQQQVDLQVEQGGGGEEHRLLHPRLGVGGHQQVHRPVRLVVVHPRKPWDRRVT